MSVEAYRQAGTGGNLTPEQINIAFRDAYGIDAPAKLLQWFQGESPNGDAFYNRVQSGVFTQDIARQYPDYLERSKNQQAINQQLETNKAAFAPIIPTLEASKTSLQARYDAILADLTNRETKDTNTIQRNVASEFAKRGIVGGSDIYQRELSSQLNPVNSQYGVLRATQNAQLGTEMNAIDKAIAEMRAGNPATAIAAGNQQYSPQTSNALNVQNAYGATPASEAAIGKTKAETEGLKFGALSDLIKQFQGLA